MQKDRDEALVRDIQEGSIGAFEELVRRYQRRLYAYVVGFVHDHHEASDVVQESFIRLYKTVDRIDPTKKFSSYMYAVARNAAISRLRVRKSHVPLDDEEHIAADAVPEAEAESADDRLRVREGLEKIDKKYRRVISLYYFNDLSYEQMSRFLNIPVNTVRTHLKRAKEALRKILT